MQLDTVTLPDNVQWPDELAWQPVVQSTERTLTGALVTDEEARTGGQPITLTGMWVTRATVEALRSLEAQVATEMTLTLPGGAQKTVLWRRDGERPVEAEPLWPDAPDVLTPDSLYSLTLRLMEV